MAKWPRHWRHTALASILTWELKVVGGWGGEKTQKVGSGGKKENKDEEEELEVPEVCLSFFMTKS